MSERKMKLWWESEASDKFGRRFAIRLLRWTDGKNKGKYSLALGLGQRIEGQKHSKFVPGHYTCIPPWCADEINKIIGTFAKGMKDIFEKDRVADEKEKQKEESNDSEDDRYDD